MSAIAGYLWSVGTASPPVTAATMSMPRCVSSVVRVLSGSTYIRNQLSPDSWPANPSPTTDSVSEWRRVVAGRDILVMKRWNLSAKGVSYCSTQPKLCWLTCENNDAYTVCLDGWFFCYSCIPCLSMFHTRMLQRSKWKPLSNLVTHITKMKLQCL